MSRFTLAAVAEMMEYKNVNGYASPARLHAAESAAHAEALGIVEWMMENHNATNAI